MTHNGSAAPRRYLALVFPWLPIERLRSTRPHLFVGRGETPVAFVETMGKVTRLIAIDHAATRAGLTPRLTLADARARVPELEVFDHDAHADHDWLERLAEGCGRYTPAVALQPPDALILTIAGCTQIFESERCLAADIEARFARRGITIRHAFGDTPAIAEALARYAGAPAPDERSAVRRLPLAALGLDEEATEALQRAGFRHVGDVMARPTATIAAHFGEDTATAVRRLDGDEGESPRSPRRDPPVVVERRLAQPVGAAQLALEAIASMTEEARAILEERRQGGRHWHVRLYRADGEVQRVRVAIERPSRDPALLMPLLRERIEALADPLDPDIGYDLIRLEVPLAESLDASQLRLEGGGDGAGSDPDGKGGELVAQASTRTRRRGAPSKDPISQQAELILPPPTPPHAAACPAAEAAEPPLRPIHLFDPPQPIDGVTVDVPDGPPKRFRWRRTLHEVARAHGPERIAAEWWRRDPARDYFRVEDRRGRRLWIFRHQHIEGAAPPRWYVHGVFA